MPGPAGKGGVLVGGGCALHREQVGAGEAGRGVGVPEVPRRARVAGRLGRRHRLRADPRSRRSTLPAIQDCWAQHPGYKVAYDQLLTGVNTPATAGPVIGAYQEVRDAVREAENTMFLTGREPGLGGEVGQPSTATAAIVDYNQRIGG